MYNQVFEQGRAKETFCFPFLAVVTSLPKPLDNLQARKPSFAAVKTTPVSSRPWEGGTQTLDVALRCKSGELKSCRVSMEKVSCSTDQGEKQTTIISSIIPKIQQFIPNIQRAWFGSSSSKKMFVCPTMFDFFLKVLLLEGLKLWRVLEPRSLPDSMASLWMCW